MQKELSDLCNGSLLQYSNNPVGLIAVFHYSITSWFQYSIPPLFYQVALDELWENRGHTQLDVPFLSAKVRVMDHILSRYPDLDW